VNQTGYHIVQVQHKMEIMIKFDPMLKINFQLIYQRHENNLNEIRLIVDVE
jgi:hypothetical protein